MKGSWGQSPGNAGDILLATLGTVTSSCQGTWLQHRQPCQALWLEWQDEESIPGVPGVEMTLL